MLTDAEIFEDIRTKPTVPVWPHYAWANGICRGTAYETARRALAEGSPEFMRHGKLLRAITTPLRRKLQIEA